MKIIGKKKVMKMLGFSSKKTTHVTHDAHASDVESDHDSSSVVELLVHMKSEECEKKIPKTISKLKGVENLEIDREKQKVIVTGKIKKKKVLKVVRKTGRKAEYWPFTYVEDTAPIVQLQHQGSSSSSSSDDDHSADDESGSTPAYNYYVHGYNQSMHGYYIDPRYVTAGDQITYTFNDENVNACTIM